MIWIRSAAPAGNIGKPLMLALGALLASGVLFRGSDAGQTANVPTQPTSDQGAGGVLGGLGGLLNKLEQGGLGDVAKSWVGSEQNQPVSSMIVAIVGAIVVWLRRYQVRPLHDEVPGWSV
jgi:uncharacterized protein YidB (DUF937 family)